MARQPPKKPTDDFAQIRGEPYKSVEKIVERFPDTKVGQEDELGRRFATTLTSQTDSLWTSRPLDEDDHDFLLIHCGREIEVQAVEIAAKRDFLTLIPPDQVKNATHEFTSVFVPKQGEVWGIDRIMLRQAIWRKIALKLGKNYAKPKRQFWLLVWTVYMGLPLTVLDAGGVSKSSRAISFARRELKTQSSGPFDEIWAWTARDEAVRVWPSDVPEDPDLDNYETTNTPANPGMFIPAAAMTIVGPGKR